MAADGKTANDVLIDHVNPLGESERENCQRIETKIAGLAGSTIALVGLTLAGLTWFVLANSRPIMGPYCTWLSNSFLFIATASFAITLSTLMSGGIAEAAATPKLEIQADDQKSPLSSLYFRALGQLTGRSKNEMQRVVFV